MKERAIEKQLEQLIDAVGKLAARGRLPPQQSGHLLTYYENNHHPCRR